MNFKAISYDFSDACKETMATSPVSGSFFLNSLEERVSSTSSELTEVDNSQGIQLGG
jgi:hypothetical protein